jgi:TetR/AcrR family transcriptional regulator, cholesterol catabolism regulator
MTHHTGAARPEESTGQASPDKRSLILDAAIDTFGESGFEQTKWATIAHRVGTGETALYHYFESKALCLLTIMSTELERSLHRFRIRTENVGDHPEALRAAIAGAYDVTPREALSARILLHNIDLLATPRKSQQEEAERQRSRMLVRRIEDEWAGLVRRGIDDGAFGCRDERETALALLALVVSVWSSYGPDGHRSLDEISSYTAEACLRIVRP